MIRSCFWLLFCALMTTFFPDHSNGVSNLFRKGRSIFHRFRYPRRVPLPDLPLDVLGLIASNLKLNDRKRFYNAASATRKFFRVQLFVHKHKTKAIDELLKNPENPPANPRSVIVAMSSEFLSHVMNFYAGSNRWSEVEYMIKYGADRSLLAYSMVRAKRHGWTEAIERMKNDAIKVPEVEELPAVNFTALNELFQEYYDAIRYEYEIEFPMDEHQQPDAATLDELLKIAVLYELPDAVTLLISYGADVNAMPIGARRPLHDAAMRGNENLVRQLLLAGADLDATDASGMTPLIFATHLDKLHIAKLLISWGAAVGIKDDKGKTPLHYVFRLLHSDSQKQNERLELVKQLLAAGANVNVEDEDGITPLHLAAGAYFYFYQGMNLLNGHPLVTRVHLAAELGWVKLIDLLLEAGANINAQNNYGWTPLHFAAGLFFDASEMLVERLINAGADISIKNNRNETARELAENLKEIISPKPRFFSKWARRNRRKDKLLKVAGKKLKTPLLQRLFPFTKSSVALRGNQRGK